MFLVYLLIVESQRANAAAVRDLSDNHKKSAFFEGRFMPFLGSSSVLQTFNFFYVQIYTALLFIFDWAYLIKHSGKIGVRTVACCIRST